MVSEFITKITYKVYAWPTLYVNVIFFLEIQHIKSVRGLALSDILTELHLFVMRCKL